MGMISFLGKSKTVSSLLAAGWLATGCVSAVLRQSPEKEVAESCDSVFQISGSKTASYFPGLDLEVQPVSGRCYRNDGMVESVKEHFIKLEKETGYSPLNKEYIMNLKKLDGMAFPVHMEKGGKNYKLTIVFCSPSSPKENIDCLAHEDKHGVEFLFPGSKEADEKLGKRFKEKGYMVNFQDFNAEELSWISGILRVMEQGMPIDDEFLESFSERKKAYEKLQKYAISEARFWKEDLSTVLSPSGDYITPFP